MKRILSIAVVASIAILSGGLPLDAQGPVLSNRLTYFDTSFVTGDVVVGGVSLFRKGAANGFATQNIAVSGVPAGAEILSATSISRPRSARSSARTPGSPARPSKGIR